MNSHTTILEMWETLEVQTALETPWFRIRKQRMRTPNGKEVDYYIHDTYDSVICVCVNADGNILVEAQYRPPVDKVSYDYPAGRMEKDDKSAEEAILRELKEETGLSTVTIKKLAIIDKEPGFSTTRIHVFLAQGTIEGEANPEDTENIAANFFSPSEILTMISEGKMSCTFCVTATFFAFKELGLLSLSAKE